MALTVKKVEKLKQQPGRYGDGHGLYLQVLSPTNHSWLLRYERGGKERWMGLGPTHTFSLDEARARAGKARQQLADGIDPLAAREAQRAAQALEAARAITFEQAARTYFDQHERKWKNAKHRAQFLSTLQTYAFPIIGRLSVAAIDTGLILKCIEPHWLDKPVTANRVRGRIESVLDWATVRGYRAGDNPARWKGHIAEVLPARGQIQKTNHYAALPFAKLPEFISALGARAGIAARALEFCILTATRTSETIGARWDEMDLTTKTWTVPAGRIKGGREHRVPLSDRALELLHKLPREDGNPHVFMGSSKGTGLSNMAMLKTLERMQRDDITVHGFRSAFRDWAAERTNYPNHVVEMALAHSIVSKAEAAYRRGDLFEKRRQLMNAWAKFCGTKPADTTAKVVDLQAGRR